MKTSPHACGVDDIACPLTPAKRRLRHGGWHRIQFQFPVPFSAWVTSSERCWVDFGKRPSQRANWVLRLGELPRSRRRRTRTALLRSHLQLVEEVEASASASSSPPARRKCDRLTKRSNGSPRVARKIKTLSNRSLV